VDIRGRQVAATIQLGGVYPYGVVIGDNNTAYVSLQGTNEVVIVDLNARRVTQRIPTPELPTGLAIWGHFLYVTHFWSGEVSLVYLPQGRVIDTVATGIDTGLSQAIELDVTRGIAYLPQSRSNAQNTNLTFDTIAFPVVNVLDLRGLTLVRENRINVDTTDRPVNMPFAVALDRFRNWLFIANAGSDNVTVVDLGSGQTRGSITTDSNPRGILLNRDNTTLFIHNALEGTLSVVQTGSLEVIDELPISNLTIPVDILLGAQYFYTAADPRLSADNWVSCGNCHFDGLSDGRMWAGFPDGPRNTPLLFGLSETPPYNWSGSWDELHDVELKIRGLQAGTGLIEEQAVNPPLGDPHAGLSLDLDILAGYLASLRGPLTPEQGDSAVIERGAAVFEEQECAACHLPPTGTDGQLHDMGTGDSPNEQAGETFDTPSLRWLWLSAPYLHDGRADTLYDVFIMPGEHQLVFDVPMDDINALVVYLLTLPQP
jgi:DNA-binding beta-propeller fold protein YncE